MRMRKEWVRPSLHPSAEGLNLHRRIVLRNTDPTSARQLRKTRDDDDDDDFKP